MWTNELSPEQVGQVLALAARAAGVDGTEPLNEEAHFALRDDSARHLLETRSDAVVGYLQWEPGYRTAQLVVDPAHRRQGVGRSLLGHLGEVSTGSTSVSGNATSVSGNATSVSGSSTSVSGSSTSVSGSSTSGVGVGSTGGGTSAGTGEWGVWAFGDLPAAQGFASALGLSATRGLLVMERPLAGITTPELPEGLTVTGFQPQDADDFLAVNAAAFAHHPEQGALDRNGLAARMDEPWFDPSGLILAWDDVGLVGFHWTKRVERTGEVYVIGVAPRAQGRGYGRVLLQAGLDHLARAGADRVVLYVDMSEPVAVRMYESAGFRVASRDVLYAPEHGSVQKQEWA